ncbi:MAG TPA: hypothetical protein VE988_14150, partial [Gemmataceae bacterium]|nr:hypothetical protein [Gemmataceae bacterium]
MPAGEIHFEIKRGEDLITVHIKDEYARIVVSMIDDVWPVYQALNKTVAAGAKRGVLFTGMVVHDQLAA